jgi:hypothetical protein
MRLIISDVNRVSKLFFVDASLSLIYPANRTPAVGHAEGAEERKKVALAETPRGRRRGK